MDATEPLAQQAIGYEGTPFAPSPGTYPSLRAMPDNYTHRCDTGRVDHRYLGSVLPLILAAMWETAFSAELGPLSTWSN